jgi:hypothetical protein
MLQNLLYEASITLILKPDNDTTKKENYRPMFLINIDANILNKMLQTEFNNVLKRSVEKVGQDSRTKHTSILTL